MKNPWILPVATLVVGAVAGYISGKNTGSEGDRSQAEEASYKTRASSRLGMAGSAENSGKRGARKGSIESIARMPGNSGRVQALLDLYSNLSADQFEAEAGKLDDLPLSERMLASFLLFGRWAETDPTAAMAFSNTMGFAGGFVRPTILHSWASTDPAGAAKYLEANPREFAMMGMGRGPMGGQSGTSIIASEWAKQDPAGALAWANGLSSDKEQALRAVVSEVAKTDPRKASEMLASMTGIEKSRAYANVAAEYGASNFAEAQTWVRTLPAEDQDAAMASAIGGLSNKDPKEAARQVALMKAGEAKDGVLSEVVGDLARIDPKSAADLLKSQGSEHGLIDGVRELMPSWVSKDASSALGFANSLAAGDARDSALRTYVWSNTTSAPADLVRVAETISDEGDRQQALAVAAARWMREDENAAKNYIQQSTLFDDEAKQRLIEGRGMGGGRGPGGWRGPGG